MRNRREVLLSLAGAVRDGDWKPIELYEDMRVELYNLKADVGGSRDLAATEAEKRQRRR